MTDDRRGVAAVLLITQSGLALLAALGLYSFIKLSNAGAQLAIPGLVALLGPVLLLVMAAGVLRNSKAAIIGVCLWEALTLLGAVFSILASGGSGHVLTSTLTGVVLPLAVVYFILGEGEVRRSLTTVLFLATAVIHLTLVPEHLAESPTLGRLFLLDALGFSVVAWCSARQSGGWWRTGAAALLIATIVAYLVVVLRGLEPVDDLGVATKFVELLALGLVVWPSTARAFNRRWGIAGLSLVASILLSGGLAWAATLRPVADGGGHTHAQADGTRIAEAAPTDQQKSAAMKLVDDTRVGIARFGDLNVALADGYRPSTPPQAATVHYSNPNYARSGVVDPMHPQALVYANTPGGPVLLGAMFMMPKANQLPPNIGGSMTEWHTHNNLCFLLPSFMIDGLESPFGTCPVGSINAPTPAMLHVWIVANPGGPFGDLTPAFAARLASGAA